MARRDYDPLIMAAYRAPFPDYWSRAGTLAFQREIPLTERDRSAPLMSSIHDGLAELDCPVLLVWGMRDPVFQPIFLEQWRELFPDADTVELQAASHFLVEDRPAEVTDAIERFLR
jgi:pimeloyl-ACP methyl ester carboxylesterase